jgi:hypothetical protein
MSLLLSPDDVRELVRAVIAERFDTQRQAAHTWGVLPQILNDALQGRRPMPNVVLDRLGIRRVIMYQKDTT